MFAFKYCRDGVSCQMPFLALDNGDADAGKVGSSIEGTCHRYSLLPMLLSTLASSASPVLVSKQGLGQKLASEARRNHFHRFTILTLSEQAI